MTYLDGWPYAQTPYKVGGLACTHRWVIPVTRSGHGLWEQEYDTTDSMKVVCEGRSHIVAPVFCAWCGQPAKSLNLKG